MSTATTQARTIVSNRTVARSLQLLAFTGAIAIFFMSLVATTRFASSPFEVFAGVVLGGILAAAIVIIGMLVPTSMAPQTH